MTQREIVGIKMLFFEGLKINSSFIFIGLTFSVFVLLVGYNYLCCDKVSQSSSCSNFSSKAGCEKNVDCFQKDVENSSLKYVDLEDVLSVFPRSIDGINQRLEFILLTSRQKINEWLQEKDQKRSILLFDSLLSELGFADSCFQVLSFVLSDKEIIDCALISRTKITEFLSKQVYCHKNYEHFKKVIAGIPVDLLEEDEKLFVKKNMFIFNSSGCDLEGQKYDYFKKMIEEEDVLVSSFIRNIALFSEKIVCSREDLKGVSEWLLASLPKTTEGLFLVGVDYPTYFDLMENCEVQETRKKAYLLFMNRAYPENDEILKKIVALRSEMAAFLSYPDYATFNIANKMAGNPENVIKFLNSVKNSVKEAADNQFAKLVRDLPEGVVLNDDGCLAPWDYLFVRNQYEKKHFEIDLNLLAEYFPLEQTLEKIFAVYEKLLGLRFEIQELKEGALWSPDVVLLKVFKTENMELVGHLLLDLYPRENKYTHACCCAIVCGINNELVCQKPVALVIANFPKAVNGQPALLKYNDVRTFFHELGHGMHCILGQTRLGIFSGYNVQEDFAETPSQMFEEWMRDPRVLQEISGHYQTKEALPSKMIDSLLRKEDFFVALNIRRQVKLSLFSLYLHSSVPVYDSFKELEEIISKEIPEPIFSVPETHFYASFGHIVSGGYTASYYLYLWSLVYAKDLWSQVELLGVESEETSVLVHDLLAAGGSVPPMVLLRKVLERESSGEAFKKYLSKN